MSQALTEEGGFSEESAHLLRGSEYEHRYDCGALRIRLSSRPVSFMFVGSNHSWREFDPFINPYPERVRDLLNPPEPRC